MNMNRSRLRHLLSLARTDPEEFTWVYTDQPGYTAVTRGEAIHLVKCFPVPVEPRHTAECFHDLPVKYQNESMFLKPGSRLLVKFGRPIPCSSLTPVLYKLDGSWTKIGGESYVVKPPISLSPNPSDIWKYGDVVTLNNIGFLSKQQLEDYRDAIIGPSERKAVKDIFISRITSHGLTASQGLNFNDGIHPDQIISQVSESVISKLYGYWDIVARNVGAILGISLLWHMVCYTINLIINGWLMFKDYGIVGVCIAALSNTVSKHLIYGKMKPFWRRQPLDRENPDEEVPKEVLMDDAFNFRPANC